VGEGFETNNKLKKIFIGEKRGMATLVRRRIIGIILLKLN
jgi:hypothetical protein